MLCIYKYYVHVHAYKPSHMNKSILHSQYHGNVTSVRGTVGGTVKCHILQCQAHCITICLYYNMKSCHWELKVIHTHTHTHTHTFNLCTMWEESKPIHVHLIGFDLQCFFLNFYYDTNKCTSSIHFMQAINLQDQREGYTNAR